MSILGLLQDRSSAPLLECGSGKWTKADFCDLVSKFDEELRVLPVGDSYILIAESDAAYFYALVFSVWKNGGRVLFPNRNIIQNEKIFPFYKYKLSIKDGMVSWKENLDYETVDGIDALAHSDAIVFSSGSTGEPKGILHSKENFYKNAKATSGLLDRLKGGSITFLKPYLISAFSHFLVHFMKDANLIFREMECMHELGDLYEAQPCLSLVGSPMHIVSARKFIPADASPRVFMSSGDFIYPSIIQRLLRSYNKSTYYYVYGLAELGGRFFINKIDASTDYDKYNCIGVNLPITNYKIEDREIKVASSALFYGYIKNGKLIPAEQLHSTGDLVKVDANCTALSGRKNDEIKIAGNKVSLKFLEQKASTAFPNDAVIFLEVNHEILGALIALVIQSDSDYRRVEVLRTLRGVLDAAEMPQYLYKIEKIPYTQSMKIDRRWISENLSGLIPIH